MRSGAGGKPGPALPQRRGTKYPSRLPGLFPIPPSLSSHADLGQFYFRAGQAPLSQARLGVTNACPGRGCGLPLEPMNFDYKSTCVLPAAERRLARGHPGPSAYCPCPRAMPSSQTRRSMHTLTQTHHTHIMSSHPYTWIVCSAAANTRPTLKHIRTCKYTLHTHGLQTHAHSSIRMANTCLCMYTQPHIVQKQHTCTLHIAQQVTHTGSHTTPSHMTAPERTFQHTRVCYGHIYSHDQMCTCVHIQTHVHNMLHSHSHMQSVAARYTVTHTLMDPHIHACSPSTDVHSTRCANTHTYTQTQTGEVLLTWTLALT